MGKPGQRELLLTGAAFAFVGLEVRAVAPDVRGDLSDLIVQSLIVTGVVIAIRLLWIFPVGRLEEKLRVRRRWAAAFTRIGNLRPGSCGPGFPLLRAAVSGGRGRYRPARYPPRR